MCVLFFIFMHFNYNNRHHEIAFFPYTAAVADFNNCGRFFILFHFILFFGVAFHCCIEVKIKLIVICVCFWLLGLLSDYTSLAITKKKNTQRFLRASTWRNSCVVRVASYNDLIILLESFNGFL
jgi:hypothetical protein